MYYLSIFDYFNNIEEYFANSYNPLGEFSRNLQDPEIRELNAKKLSLSIYKIALFDKTSKNKQIHKTFRKNSSLWFDTAIEKMPEFEPQSLALSLWALATLGIRPSNGFIAAWEAQAIEKMPEFNPQDLANSLRALATLRIRPTDAFIDAWEKRAIEKMPEFDQQNLAQSLWALASLGIRPSDAFIDAWKKRAIEKMLEFKPWDLANNLWALAVMGCLGAKVDRTLVQELYKNFLEKYNPKKDKKGINQARNAGIYFGLDVSSIEIKPWGSFKKSQNEKRLVKIFKQHEAEIQSERGDLEKERQKYIPEIDTETDHIHILWGGRRVILEFDGEYHFNTEPPSQDFPQGRLFYNGHTILMSALVDRFTEYSLIRIMDPLYRIIMNARGQELKTLLQNFEQAVSNLGPTAKPVCLAGFHENQEPVFYPMLAA